MNYSSKQNDRPSLPWIWIILLKSLVLYQSLVEEAVHPTVGNTQLLTTNLSLVKVVPNLTNMCLKIFFIDQFLLQWIPDIWIHSKSACNVVLKLIFKCMTAVMLSHWSAQKESCWDVRSFKGLNTIYENIYK